MKPPEPAPGARAPLAVEVTASCNRYCRYCYHEARMSTEPELPASRLVHLVEQALAESGRRAIQFSGGEPLVRRDFLTIARALRKPGRRLSLVTDGGMVDEHMARQLKELDVALVQPTLLAADRHVHDQLKGTIGAFDRTIRGIAHLQRVGVPIALSFICTGLNHAHFAEVLELAFALGIRNVAFNRFCTAGFGAKDAAELQPTTDQVQACLDIASKAVDHLGLRVHIAISIPHCVATPEHLKQLRFGGCALGTEVPGLTIDPWGRLRACSISAEPLGDLTRESWTTIMERAECTYFPALRALPQVCRECPRVALCRGGCRESARMANGSPGAFDPLVPVARRTEGA